MSNKPTITVLMAVYNGEKYLKEAIDSILGQTYSDFEFIIIDDASTDKTKGILNSFIDKRIRIINNNLNVGLTKSLNKGLIEAKGEYVARMDADDISLPERLDIQRRFLDENKNIVCVGSGAIIINSLGKTTGLKSPISNPELLKFYMILKNQIMHPSVMFRKKIIQQLGGYDESIKYAQDYNLWSKLLSHGYKVDNIGKPLLRYRLHEKSITQGNKKGEAYKSATEITYSNILRYTEINRHDFDVLMQAYHKHIIERVLDLYKIIRAWNRFRNCYIDIEKPNKELLYLIKSYINNEKTNSARWYVRSRYGTLYRLLTKIKKLYRK